MKTIQKITFLSVFILFAFISCQDAQEVANEVVCVGYNSHNHSESITHEYLPVAGTDCLESSQCETLKQRLITKADGLATSYCRNYRCNDGDRSICKGRFTLTGSTCTVTSRIIDGQTICTETVAITGVIDCYCD